MKLFVPKTNSAGPMNFQKKRCLGRIGGGNIKHLFVPAANLNYNSFQSESDKNGLLVQIAIVHIPQSDVFCCASCASCICLLILCSCIGKFVCIYTYSVYVIR